MMNSSYDNPMSDFITFSTSSLVVDNNTILGSEEKLKKQIEEYESLETALKQQIEDRRKRYDESIEELQQRIEKESEKFEKVFEDQEAEQESEFSSLKRHLEDELASITASTNENDEKYAKETHDLVQSVQKELETCKLMTDVCEMENEVICQTLIGERTQEQQKRTKKILKKEIQKDLKMREKEVDERKADIKFIRERYSNILAEIQNAMNVQKQSYELTKQKIIREMKKRDKFFNKHINIVERTIENEVRQTSVEISSIEERLNAIISIKRAKQKKWSGILDSLTKDIVSMQRDIEEEKETINDNDQTISTSILRTAGFESETESYKRTEAALLSELQRVNSEVNRSVRILKEFEKAERRKSDKHKLSHSMFY